MQPLKLYMALLGASPEGRHTEQHDTFFSIGHNLAELVPAMKAFWPEAKLKLHVDAWRAVTSVDGFQVEVIPKNEADHSVNQPRLFFINLGGYKRDEFDEFHYKMVIAAADKGEAIRKAKESAFYKHTGFKEANSHIDDKFGIDVDDFFEIADILPAGIKEQYALSLKLSAHQAPDAIHLGYYKLDKLDGLS